MKIAIIGNMNNNGFALMRYLRDLGADAHLLLYSNDGVGSLAHFTPENDSFNYLKWCSCIHQTDLFNGPHQLFPNIIQRVFVILFNLRASSLSRALRLAYLPVNRTKQLLSGYDCFVTSGYAPAILLNAGIETDVFSPYSSGIEGVGRLFAPRTRNLLARGLFEFGRLRQITALKHTKHILCAEMGITQDVIKDMRLPFKPLAMPMVYIEQDYPVETGDDCIDQVGSVVAGCDFTVFMHSRLAWNPDVCKRNHVRSKNNHWVLIGFKAVIDDNPNINAKLVILEYGPDVINTKSLVTKLKLDEHVVWVPKTSRKNLIWLLDKVSIGVGEFIESPRTIWGGTGWEVLASGKPLLQGFFYEVDAFEDLYGYAEPPLLKVRCQEDVTKHLLELADKPTLAKRIGQESREWFNRYNGIALAKQWLDMLVASREDEGDTKNVTVNQSV